MRFYKISCAILAVVFVIVLILTLLSNQTHYREADPDSVTVDNCIYYYVEVDDMKRSDGTVLMEGGYVRVIDYLSVLREVDGAMYYEVTGDYTKLGTFYETYLLFDGPLLNILLGVVAVLLIICVCISQIYGGKTYKIGFFILHGGLAVLLVGFVVQNLVGQSVSFVLDVNGRYQNAEGTVYTDMTDATEKLDIGVEIAALDMQVEKYPDTEMVKEYDLTIETRKGNEDTSPMQYELKVNHPIHVNGVKIYLMNYADGAVVLMAKRNPMEYTILFGIIATLAGTVIMCLFRKDGGRSDD